jgi:peptidoglycan/xylan/chitin deacetylase (PgdA/CDA1 family)
VRSGQQKQRQQSRLFYIFLDAVLLIVVLIGVFFLTQKRSNSLLSGIVPQNKFSEIVNKPLPTPTPTPSPTPSPKPLTFAEMNTLYGPCVRLPVLMYHHIQSRDAAVAKKQTKLTVYTDVFQAQMQYLKSKNYNTVTMNDLVNFFDSGTSIPGHSLLLTFDDGYQDFYTDAYPILSGLGFKSTVFVPTGLMENPDYLTWGEISGMTSSVLFANHTWSHKSVVTQTAVMEKEISTADSQLAERGLNSPKIFAYPYGPDSISAENYLSSLGYKAAFTTTPGNILCKKQRLGLPRIRVGDTSLSYYGF